MENENNFGIVNWVNEKSLCYYSPGDFIIEQGEKINYILYVEKGKASIVHKNSNGKEFTFLQVKEGDYLGIHSLFTKERSFVSVIASEALVAYKITEESLNKAINEKSEISLELIKHLCSKIGLVESKIAKTIPKNIRGQVVKILLSNKQSGIKAGHTITYTINELANLVGTTKNYIYRILSELEQLKLLSIKDKKVNVLDEHKLARFIQNNQA
jgi:CRP-like cAMP-binding protein